MSPSTVQLISSRYRLILTFCRFNTSGLVNFQEGTNFTHVIHHDI